MNIMSPTRSVLAAILAAFLLVAPLEVRAENPAGLTLSPSSQQIPPEYFGMHIHRAGGTTPWPVVPMAEWRLWDAYVAWPNLEPVKGQWHFETLDKYLALAAEHNVGLVLPLGLSPAWASARPSEKSVYQPGFAAEPKNIEDWRIYVSTVARHCKGRVHAYEIWNEPNLKLFWTGTVSQMVILTREASKIVHSIDPQALVVSPSATQEKGTDWLTEFLDQGGGEFVDVIGYHFYVAPQAPEATVPLVLKVKRILAEHGAAGKPIWNTETGWFMPKPFPSEALAAAYLARAYLLNWAAGIQRLYWYSWDNHGWVTLETTEQDSRTLKPAGKAYAGIFHWLAGARIRSCVMDQEQTWICELERGADPQRIVWNAAGSRKFVPPQAWHARNISLLLEEERSLTDATFDIGPMPVLVTSRTP
jgi:hypothetical protein